ncbi:MAG: insulinase family protein [Phycisphaerae bacterium]|nr:insulinase family protein [Phycisphaerae bacterium]
MKKLLVCLLMMSCVAVVACGPDRREPVAPTVARDSGTLTSPIDAVVAGPTDAVAADVTCPFAAAMADDAEADAIPSPADVGPFWAAGIDSAAWITLVGRGDAMVSAEGLTVVKLDNGLTVIVKEARTAPVVDVRCYVLTGSMYEGAQLGAGMSHLLEHLVAGEAGHDGEDADDEKPKGGRRDRIAQIGGQSNAYTTIDHTAYYITASAGKTMECVDLISDWMVHGEFTRADFEREHGVVQRELEMGKDNPDRQFYYASAAAVFRDHPAGVPTIGFKAPLAALTYEIVRDYHARMYVPQNMIFVVTGDVKTADVMARIRKNFAAMPAALQPDRSLPPTPAITGVRRVLLPHPEVKEAVESIDFATIDLFDPDLYALDLLATILGDGQSSRLNVELVRKARIVTSVRTSSWTPAWGRGVFSVDFRCDPARADEAQKAVLSQLFQVAIDGVSADEVDRAKRQKIAELVRARQTVSGLAADLGRDYMATGQVGFSDEYVRRIGLVTADDVLTVARKYFRFDDMVITRMVPAGSVAAASAGAEATATATTETFTLPNGLRVILQPSGGSGRGLVSMVLVNLGGVLPEDETTNGMGMLMSMLGTKGTKRYTAEAIADFFDRAGGSITGNCGSNTFYWQATVLDDSFDKAMDIFADVVLHPTYPAEELEIVRPQVLAAIARQDANWQSQLMKFFREKFFVGSPFRFQPLGSADVVKAVTAERLAAYHKEQVRAGAAVLAVYGKFDATATRAFIEKQFAVMPAGAAELTLPAARQVPPGGELHVLPTRNEQAAIVVAAPGLRFQDVQDRLALDVLDTIISGYQLPGGWLHEELRGKQLVYVVHAVSMAGVAPGSFFAYAGTQPETQQEVIDIIVKNLRKASEYTPSQEEIDQSVNIILTAQLLGKQTVGSMAMEAALNELYGLGHDFQNKIEALYRAVTPADVARVGKQYLGGDYVIIVTTPKAEGIAIPDRAAVPEATTEETAEGD